MYSHCPTMSSTSSNPGFDELQWVINIRRSLEEELQDGIEIPVSIFNVPKTLMAISPYCYIPQQVALGPYHYLRPELYEMERYKLSAARRTQDQLQSCQFEDFIQHFVKLEHRIRACYHKFLNINGETLAWMMAIDASFLLEFLQIYLFKEGKALFSVSAQMKHVVDYAGRKFAHNAILRDVVMLENQIPLFVLRKMLEIQFCSSESADDMLVSMLLGIRKDLCPFRTTDNIPKIDVSKCAHLLDFLYQTMVPKVEDASEMIEIEENQNCQETPKEKESETSMDSSYVKQVFVEMWTLILCIDIAPVRRIKQVLSSEAVMFILTLPWNLLSNLPGFSIIKNVMDCFRQDGAIGEPKPENEDSPPLVEEIEIPSVTELLKSGVRFVPTKGTISSIEFNSKDATLHLPPVSLDVNTAAVLRNLVAYEALNGVGPLVFTRYTELMTGIIDTAEDVRILRKRGIVTNRMRSDEEAAELWNGMSKSIRLTRVPLLDKVIEDVNRYHKGRWSVKWRKLMKSYVYASWRFLTLLATITLLVLTSFQSFCSVYGCSGVLRIKANETAPFWEQMVSR